jgi:hypothetical protein
MGHEPIRTSLELLAGHLLGQLLELLGLKELEVALGRRFLG